VVTIPVKKYFPDEQAFPYFVHPYALNSQAPHQLLFCANRTQSSFERAGESGWWAFNISNNVTRAEDIAAPTFVASSGVGSVLRFVAGGFTNGASDPDVLVAINSTHLYFRSAATGLALVVRPLPVAFADPVTLSYDSQGNVILGPVSHGQTVSLAVSAADSSLVAVTGWPAVLTNDGVESVWVTADAGATWRNVTGNLRAATATVGQMRPSGLLLVDFPELNASALLVSTVSGVFLSWTDASRQGQWSRFGLCNDLPLVLAKGLSYEPYSDTLLVATMGRGVYTMANAKAALGQSRLQQQKGSCSSMPSLVSAPPSSARFFPVPHA
jgi:hypothetical protein